MKIIIHLLLLLSVFTFISSCKKETDQLDIELLIQGGDVKALLNQKVLFGATPKNGDNLSHEWKLDGATVSTSSNYTFSSSSFGTFKLEYLVNSKSGSNQIIYNIIVAVPVIDITANSTKYISTIFAYQPGPGQFINTPLGNASASQSILGNPGTKTTFVSLGGFGGYIIFGFNHSVKNITGADFGIYGQATATRSEPGIVMVSQDVNGNGRADDKWYELAGSEYDKTADNRKYSITYTNPKDKGKDVTWLDINGNTGVYTVPASSPTNYYPTFIPSTVDKATLTGSLLPSTFNSTDNTNAAFPSGYANNWSTIATDNYPVNGYNSFEIDNARDENGRPVVLKTIDFIRVHTAQLEKGNATTGEIATRLRGAIDLNPDVKIP